jgi:hypothetical protein
MISDALYFREIDLSQDAGISAIHSYLSLFYRIINGIIKIDKIDDPSSPTLILKPDEVRPLQSRLESLKMSLTLTQIDQLMFVHTIQPQIASSEVKPLQQLLKPIITVPTQSDVRLILLYHLLYDINQPYQYLQQYEKHLYAQIVQQFLLQIERQWHLMDTTMNEADHLLIADRSLKSQKKVQIIDPDTSLVSRQLRQLGLQRGDEEETPKKKEAPGEEKDISQTTVDEPGMFEGEQETDGVDPTVAEERLGDLGSYADS